MGNSYGDHGGETGVTRDGLGKAGEAQAPEEKPPTTPQSPLLNRRLQGECIVEPIWHRFLTCFCSSSAEARTARARRTGAGQVAARRDDLEREAAILRPGEARNDNEGTTLVIAI